MYEHVIVPFDGALESRAAFAPAADLAWRCGAKLVVVSTTPIDDQVLRGTLKSQAMAKSGADVDFWVDLGRELGDAVVEAARFRSAPVICVSSRRRRAGLRRREVVAPVPDALLRRSPAPLLVIGPEAEVDRGLPVAEVYVPLDASAESRRAAALAGALARSLRLALRLLVFVPPEVDDPRPPAMAQAVLDDLRERVREATIEVVQTALPAAALSAIVSESRDGMVLLPGTGGDARAALGPFADEVISTCRRAVLLPAPVV